MIISSIELDKLKKALKGGKFGYEKEALRINDQSLSSSNHPKSLGSKLCHNFITTDFAESQLELITPPQDYQKNAINFLDDISHFVTRNIDQEYLWPFSMPPKFVDEDSIKIADFGDSNLGIFKKIYRKGLANRYGKMMQSISGFHFNYSLPKDIWDIDYSREGFYGDKKKYRSEGYMKILRNITRMNWLILYLTGASPIISENLLLKKDKNLKEIEDGVYYLPNATSLRMSDLGYKNSSRSTFHISTDSFEKYINDLRSATSMKNLDFLKIDYTNNSISDRGQINPNFLQIEDEYYAVARVKSENISDKRFINRILSSGVDFIELRSLDLNPFERVGIDHETALFLECFLIYCFVIEDSPISKNELEIISQNDHLVSRNGREKDLKIRSPEKLVTLSDWGKSILDEIQKIAEVLDEKDKAYTRSIILMREKLDFPEQTTSSKILDELAKTNESFLEMGLKIAERNKSYYDEVSESGNKNWNIIKNEVARSISLQSKLELEKNQEFDTYIDRYFNL